MANAFDIDGLGNYRYPGPAPFQGDDATVVIEGDDKPQFDDSTGTIQIPQDDGSLVISFDPPEPDRPQTKTFDDNLAMHLDDGELSAIGERLLRGIEADDQSRADWLTNMEGGLALLGLEVKIPRGASAAATTPSEGISTIDSPLLLEACLRFQANARAELLPADGPVKVRIDGPTNAVTEDLAKALEQDLNHYLTVTAEEYVPDTDKMLFLLGFGGVAFKKGYHDPIKRRPVIASIAAKDLIVSNAATNLEGAGRVTHRFFMRPSMIKRMQMAGAYRDVPLPNTMPVTDKNPVETKIDQIQGVAPPAFVEFPEDRDRELYETYCELDITGFQHQADGKDTGLPLPYKVVIDKEARKVLEIRRNWDENDPLYMPINRITAFIFVPGLGFYGIGLLNIIGNTTKAMTAAWRLMLDSGMYANFPGFLYLKQLGKQFTNQFRVPPGGGLAIDGAGAQDIRQIIMPLPYKDPSAIFIQLCQALETGAQRVGGTAEMQVGEGKQDAPVGTTLALIEQATKIMAAVHKRLHQNQTQEFTMLRGLLMEDPAALWRHNKKSAVLAYMAAEAGVNATVMMEKMDEAEHEQRFLAALSDINLIPAADPNTSSQTERYLKCMALRQMAMSDPAMDLQAVDRRIVKIMGVDDGDSLFKPPPPPGAMPPPPEVVLAQAAATEAQAKMFEAQNRLQEARMKWLNDTADRTSREKIASIGVAKDMAKQHNDHQLARDKMAHDATQKSYQRSSTLGIADLNNRAKLLQQTTASRDHMLEQGHQMAHDATQSAAQRGFDRHSQARDHLHEHVQNRLSALEQPEPQPPPTSGEPGKKGVAG